MQRKMIHIHRDKCNGCGKCVQACHEGAIQIINGIAQLLREDYCDGLGDCLPSCPCNAITFELRNALAYDKLAVMQHQKRLMMEPGTCPEHASHVLKDGGSSLSNWPIQLQLAPVSHPQYQDADMVIAADCTAFAYASFHKTFGTGHVVLIGCPKLDTVAYAEKLTAIFRQNKLRSIQIVRMEVPCCSGLHKAVEQACQLSETAIVLTHHIITRDGHIVQ